MPQCLITLRDDATYIDQRGTYYYVESPALGTSYVVQSEATAELAALASLDKVKLARWVVDQGRLGSPYVSITSEAIDSAAIRPRLGVMDRVQRLYEFLGGALGGIGASVPWVALWGADNAAEGGEAIRAKAQTWTESADLAELDALVEYGKARGIVRDGPYAGHIQLSLDGWHFLEQLKQGGGSADQAFVAMWFGDEVKAAYEEGMLPAIRDAGYIPMRIDQKEHSNRIDDEIIAEIRRSRFLIADFTCGVASNGESEVAIPRGGVYYEAGFAQGLGIPVIWMCREDHINHVHFDTRQFNHITWKTPDDLRDKLKNRIGAVLGDGPHVRR